jgi:hypothetical protein
MDKIKAACKCGKTYTVSAEHAGKSLRCKTCQAVVKIPMPELIDEAEVEESSAAEKETPSSKPDAAPQKPAVKTPVGTAPGKRPGPLEKTLKPAGEDEDAIEVPDGPRLEDKYTPEQIQIIKDTALAFWLSIIFIIPFLVILEPVAFYFAFRAKKAMKERNFFEPERTATLAMLISAIVFIGEVIGWIKILI